MMFFGKCVAGYYVAYCLALLSLEIQDQEMSRHKLLFAQTDEVAIAQPLVR